MTKIIYFLKVISTNPLGIVNDEISVIQLYFPTISSLSKWWTEITTNQVCSMVMHIQINY